uniref:Uncharacterized protein n=1 Tax=Timema cristinae TaxID=61476 RepID=A0A7R9H556_TIMCR|nr:unnamed protein product [Timema cristinae]
MTLLGYKDSRFVEERRRRLQHYLRCVMNHLVQTNLNLVSAPDKELLISLIPFFGEVCSGTEDRGRRKRPTSRNPFSRLSHSTDNNPGSSPQYTDHMVLDLCLLHSYLQNSPTFHLIQHQTHTNGIPYDCSRESVTHQLQCNYCIAECIGLTTGTTRQQMNRNHIDTNHNDRDKPIALQTQTHSSDFNSYMKLSVLTIPIAARCTGDSERSAHLTSQTWLASNQWSGSWLRS